MIDKRNVAHTPEPWELVVHGNTMANDKYIQILSGSWDIAHNRFSNRDFNEELANAQRIVACVNGCEGINPEAIQDLLLACEIVKVDLVYRAHDGDAEAIANLKLIETAIDKIKK